MHGTHGTFSAAALLLFFRKRSMRRMEKHDGTIGNCFFFETGQRARIASSFPCSIDISSPPERKRREAVPNGKRNVSLFFRFVIKKLEMFFPVLQENSAGRYEKKRKILFVNRNRNCFLQKNGLSLNMEKTP